MVSRDNNYLLVIVGSPIPKRMAAVIFISDVPYVTCQYKDISCNLQRIMFDITAIFRKFQMKVGCVLEPYHFTKKLFFSCSNICSPVMFCKPADLKKS